MKLSTELHSKLFLCYDNINAVEVRSCVFKILPSSLEKSEECCCLSPSEEYVSVGSAGNGKHSNGNFFIRQMHKFAYDGHRGQFFLGFENILLLVVWGFEGHW